MKVSGSTAEQGRIYNERIILQLVRQNPHISRVKLAELTGLSSQTISVITSSLLKRQLLEVTGKVKGRRGQPSIKLSINAQGAYSLGINIDRDHISAALLDFTGHCVLLREKLVSFPTEEVAKNIAQELLAEVKQTLGEDWCKVQGIGLTRPGFMDAWLETLVTDAAQRNQLNDLKLALSYWQSNAFELWLEETSGVACYCENDATAAATSEVLLSANTHRKHLFYIFVSTACGGSFVADGECYLGAHGQAGRFGMIATATGKHGKWTLEALSLSSLRRYFEHQQTLWPHQEDGWGDAELQPVIKQWSQEVIAEIKPALLAVLALYDPADIILAGRLPAEVNRSLIDQMQSLFNDQTLLVAPEISAAQAGYSAGVMGAAILPLYEVFSPQRDLLLLSSKPGLGE